MSWMTHGYKSLAIEEGEQILEITVPIRFVKARGRRRLYGETTVYSEPTDNTLKEALVKAHRWERKLLRGEATSIQTLAQRECVDKAICPRFCG
ncbi:hypothetical protein [Parendozoicomonas sp. Alg238-R29]|uniref:hypothetical protein n=1 Tax=Parendozoicomonas sp. Alg238-R29 TaxID=2993446 RepID=UPI00248E2F18|nr:hypothetical protein [Parendozoicomonas sp. Alg238-R29]